MTAKYVVNVGARVCVCEELCAAIYFMQTIVAVFVFRVGAIALRVSVGLVLRIGAGPGRAGPRSAGVGPGNAVSAGPGAAEGRIQLQL